MKDKLLYFGKLSASAAFSFVKINALGFISWGLTFSIAFVIMVYKVNPGQSAHASALPFLIGMVFGFPFSTLMMVFLGFVAPYLFFSLGTKYVVSKTAHRIITDRSESMIVPILDKILSKVFTEQSGLLKRGADYALLKLKLIEQAKNETENKWVRRVIVFGLKQVKLDDVEFGNDAQDNQTIIRNKILKAIHEISKPSRKLIWLLIGVQWLILLLIWLLPV